MPAYNQGRSNRNAFVFPEINADAFFDHTRWLMPLLSKSNVLFRPELFNLKGIIVKKTLSRGRRSRMGSDA